jgi:formate-dependent nitrite reductase membrane component NrfD
VGPNPYVIEPHWADWKLVLEMFVAGVAAGTFLFIALANFASDRIFRTRTVRTERTDRTVRTDRTSVVVDEDVEVAARAGLVPFPLMLLVGLLLVVDLGEPFRFLNIVFRSPGAAERGPLPIMFNLNSPMNWGTYIIMVFGLFATVAFLDALWHRRTFRGLSIVETLSHNPIWLAIGAFFALATGAYSGVLVNVTSQNVWGDTILLGAAYVAFSALSGMAVAAIIADRMGARRTAAAVQNALFWFAAICGVIVLLIVLNLALVGRAFPLIADLEFLVAPVFWIGVVGLAILYPLLTYWRGGPVRVRRSGTTTLAVAGYDLGRLAIVGAGVLIGVLAFRYVLLYSAAAAVH